jgi:hypothetical protein
MDESVRRRLAHQPGKKMIAFMELEEWNGRNGTGGIMACRMECEAAVEVRQVKQQQK